MAQIQWLITAVPSTTVTSLKRMKFKTAIRMVKSIQKPKFKCQLNTQTKTEGRKSDNNFPPNSTQLIQTYSLTKPNRPYERKVLCILRESNSRKSMESSNVLVPLTVTPPPPFVHSVFPFPFPIGC